MSKLLSDLDPDVAEKASQLQLAASALGHMLGITQTYRTFPEQQAIWEQGRSLPGVIVTHSPAGYSWHNWRRAFDVCFMVEGKPSWDGDWDVIGSLGEQVGLEWGGRWKHPDRPHFQDTGGRTLAMLMKLYPEGMG